jgi:exonuclease III
MRIAFWNIKKKSFIKDIIEFISKKDIDIFILTECTVSISKIEEELNRAFPKKKYKGLIKGKNPKFKIFTRLDIKCIKNFDKSFGGPSWTINKITIRGLMDLSIIAVHFPSKMHWDDLSQSLEAVNLMSQIRRYELKNGRNTLVIGDFNMNPYEPGMVSSLGMHGIKDANIVKKQSRIVQGKSYDYFYNPMWNFLGDESNVPGTFFYKKAIHHNVMWNTFDQILIRPNLLNFIKISDIEIISNIGVNKLIDSRTKQIKKEYSDHLPLLLTLNI